MSKEIHYETSESKQTKSIKRPVPTDGIARTLKPILFLPVALWVIAAFFIAELLGGVWVSIFEFFGLTPKNTDTDVYNSIISLAIYVMLIAITLGVPKLAKLLPKDIDIKRLLGFTRLLRYRDIAFAAVGFAVYLFLGIAVSYAVSKLVPGYDGSQAQDLDFSKVLLPTNVAFVFISLVVIAPIAEEIIFRGYLFNSLRRAVPVWVAALITSIIFGTIHGQWNVGLDVFVMSMVSCYLRYRTGSLWASILLHMAKNGLAFYVLYVAAGHIL